MPKFTLTFDPVTHNQYSSSSHCEQLTVKFEINWAKTVVCSLSIMSFTQSVKVDLWPCDLKSIGFLLSSRTVYMWSLKVIGQKLKSVSCPQGFIAKVDLDLWSRDPKSIGFPSHHEQLTCKIWNWSGKLVVCILPTMFFKQSAQVDLWPGDPKSKGFLLSIWLT